MTFRELKIGDRFEFSSRREYPLMGGASGPWTKVSPRCYTRDRDGMRCRVGSVNVGVDKEPQEA